MRLGTETRWLRDRWFWAAIALTLLMLAGGYVLKARCLDVPWDGSQYTERCYNDLQVIWSIRGLEQDQIPYVEAFNEYPLVSAMWMYGAALGVDTDRAFFTLNVVGLGLLALGTTILLYFLVEDKRRTLLWAAAPPLLLYAFHNWDLIAVFLAVAGWYAYRRDRLLVAGALFAVAASAKVWPGLFVPFIALELFRRDRRLDGPATRFVAAAGVAFLVLHGPWLLWDAGAYLEGYRWQLDRGPTFESFWGVAHEWSTRWSMAGLAWLTSAEVLPVFTKLIFGAGLLALAAAVWWDRLDALTATFAATTLMLVANQVFSLQYVLWLVPFFVLMPRFPVVLVLAFFAADALVFWRIWPFFAGLGGPDSDLLYARLSLAVAYRFAVLVAFLGLVAAWALRPELRRWVATWRQRAEPQASEP